MELEIIESCDVKHTTQTQNSFIKINLESNTLSKFPMQILYYKEQGFKNFILEYKYDKISHSFERISQRILSNISNIIKSHEVKIGLSGFPKCVFEQYFKTPELNWEFENSYFFLKGTLDTIENEKCLDCEDCTLKNTCLGISSQYLKKFKEQVEPIVCNKYLEKYYSKFGEYLEDEELKKNYFICLQNFCEEKDTNNKKIYFRERISSGSDEFREGFYYQIENSKKLFEENYEFVKDSTFESIELLKKYIEKSSIITLGFEILSDSVLRKKIEINTRTLHEDEVNSLFNISNFEYNGKIHNFDTIKLEIEKNQINIVEVSQKIDKIKPLEVKSLFREHPIEQKKQFFRFLNSMHKDILNSSYKEKFELGILVSKGFETSPKTNLLRLRALSVLFSKDLNFLMEKEIKTLWFEISEFQNEKNGFVYAPKLPRRLPEEEEYKKQFYNQD